MTNDDTFPKLAANAFLNADLSTKIKMLLALYEYLTTEDITGKIETNIKRYEEYWKKSIDYIYQINPDITIVATEFYNPYYGISLFNYDFSGLVDGIMQKMNKILYSCSNSETKYKIAKIYSTFNTTNPRLTNVNLSLTNFNIDPHPSALGHEIISLKILESLSPNNSEETKTNISTLSISDIPDQNHTGSAITPALSIKNKSKLLVEGTDYITIYHNNINVGQAYVFIIGIGNYTGKTVKTFNIKSTQQKDISTLKVTISPYQVYLGINIEPEVSILDDTRELIRNQDYILKYNNNINVGIASITITGIGNYTGTAKTNFIIVPLPINETVVLDIPNQLYTGNEITPEITISHGAVKLIKDKDYTLEYKNNVQIGTASVVITGKGNFSDVITKEFNIVENQDSNLKNISMASVSKINETTYTGHSLTPTFTVTLNDTELKRNTDYKVFYHNNINVGIASLSIEGIGNYTGRIQSTFEIVPKDIDNLGIDDIPDQDYTGQPIQPHFTVSDNLTKLTENKDYTVSYFNNTKVGSAIIHIKGIGNYTGSIYKTFNIVSPEVQTPVEDTPPVPKPPVDDTTINQNIPHAGVLKTYLVLIISLTMLSIIFYKLSRKNY